MALATGLYCAMQGLEGRKHLYHMVPKVSWEKLKSSRQPYFPPTYEQVGTALRLVFGLCGLLIKFSVCSDSPRLQSRAASGESL